MAKITFGILALNAQPLLEYNLRALYPYAHEIIVVEGATRAAASLAGPDGHSSDDTLTMLKTFKINSDPEHKLSIVSAINEGYPDGFWPEKNEMSSAYAKRATGDWLWQVDSDEFYMEEDLLAIVRMLEKDETISAVSFPYVEFFGGFSYRTIGAWHLYEHPRFHRLFRWKKNYTYLAHRPPTVIDENGINLRKKHWVDNPHSRQRPILLFHYSYVFPKQASQKVGYYSHVEWTRAFKNNQRWMTEEYLALKHPMFLGERGWPNLQWLERYTDKHPAVIEQIKNDLGSGRVTEVQRSSSDIEELLASPIYTLERILARIYLWFYWPLRVFWKHLRNEILGKDRADEF